MAAPNTAAPAAPARPTGTRQTLLETTRELVAAEGYAAASVAEIARRAGLSTGALYRHFDSHAELLTEVFREAADGERELIAAIAGDPDRPPEERLAACVEAFSRRALAAPQLAWSLMGEPVGPEIDEARLQSKRAYRDLFAGLLDEGAEAGAWPGADSPLLAAAIVGALQEALLGPLRHEGPADALVASLTDFVTGAVHTRSPEEQP